MLFFVQLLDIIIASSDVIHRNEIIECDAIEPDDISVEIKHFLYEILQSFLIDIFICHLIACGRMHRVREQEFRLLEILDIGVCLDIVDHIVLS